MNVKLGLYLYDGGDPALARKAAALLKAQMIPLAGFTQEPCPSFADRDAFLRHAARTLLRPGEALHAADVCAHLSGDAYPGNMLRHAVSLPYSLMPYLRMNGAVRDVPGGHLLGESLLVAHLQEDGRVDMALPGGVWTDMLTGQCFSGARLRLMRPPNRAPLLAAPGAVIPVGVNDRTEDYDPADRLTLHWFQPEGEAAVILHTGESYRLRLAGDAVHAEASTDKPFHLILHRDGEEQFIR